MTGWGKNLAKSSSHDERVRLVEADNDVISVKRQCQLLQVNRSSVYRFHAKEREETEEQNLAHGESLENLELMRRLDELHFEHPAWGYRKMTDYVRNIEHRSVNWKRIRRLMRKMGLETLYPKPNLSKLFHAQYVRPYLLKGLEIDHADQVWGIDITYLPLRSGFLYLFIVIDWYSRYIVDYEISFSLEKEFVILCLSRALGARTPEIINSDQGSHFTNADYLNLLQEHGVKISMDGKGRCRDNIRTERFFRSLKYEDVYIKEYNGAAELRSGVHDYIKNYCLDRPHQSLGGRTPAACYFEGTNSSATADEK